MARYSRLRCCCRRFSGWVWDAIEVISTESTQFFTQTQVPLPRFYALEINPELVRDEDALVCFILRYGNNIRHFQTLGAFSLQFAAKIARALDPEVLEVLCDSSPSTVAKSFLERIVPRMKLRHLSAVISSSTLVWPGLSDAPGHLESLEIKVDFPKDSDYRFGVNPARDTALQKVLDAMISLFSKHIQTVKTVSLCLRADESSFVSYLLQAVQLRINRVGSRSLLPILNWIDLNLFPIEAFRSPSHSSFFAEISESTENRTLEDCEFLFRRSFGLLSPVEQLSKLQASICPHSYRMGLPSILLRLFNALPEFPPTGFETWSSALWTLVSIVPLYDTCEEIPTLMERLVELLESPLAVDCFAGRTSELAHPIWRAVLERVDLSRKTGFFKSIMEREMPDGASGNKLLVMQHPDFDPRCVLTPTSALLPRSHISLVLSLVFVSSDSVSPELFHLALTMLKLAKENSVNLTITECTTNCEPPRSEGAYFIRADFVRHLCNPSERWEEFNLLFFDVFDDAACYLHWGVFEPWYKRTGNFSLVGKIRGLFDAKDKDSRLKKLGIFKGGSASGWVRKTVDLELWQLARQLAHEDHEKVEQIVEQVFEITDFIDRGFFARLGKVIHESTPYEDRDIISRFKRKIDVLSKTKGKLSPISESEIRP